MTFKFTNGPNVVTIDYPVYLYPTWVRYPIHARTPFDNGGALTTEGTLDLRGDGWFNFHGKIDPSTILSRLDIGLNDDLQMNFVTGFVLNNGGFKREVKEFLPYWNYREEGMVRELGQEFIRTLDAGFRIILAGQVRVN